MDVYVVVEHASEKVPHIRFKVDKKKAPPKIMASYRPKKSGASLLKYKPRVNDNAVMNRLTFGPSWSFNTYCAEIGAIHLKTAISTDTTIHPTEIFARDRFIQFDLHFDGLELPPEARLELISLSHRLGIPPIIHPERLFINGSGIRGSSGERIPEPFMSTLLDCHMNVELIETKTLRPKKPCDSCTTYHTRDPDVFGIVHTHPLQPYRLNPSVTFKISFTCTSCCYGDDVDAFTSFFLKFTAETATYVTSPFIVLNESSRSSKRPSSTHVVMWPTTCLLDC